MGAVDLYENGKDVAVIEYHSGDSYQTSSATSRSTFGRLSTRTGSGAATCWPPSRATPSPGAPSSRARRRAGAAGPSAASARSARTPTSTSRPSTTASPTPRGTILAPSIGWVAVNRLCEASVIANEGFGLAVQFQDGAQEDRVA